MNPVRSFLRAAAGLAVAVTVAAGLAASPAPLPLLASLADHDTVGGSWDGERLHGKVVLVEFWATWCAPCLAEMPTLREVLAEHGSDGFEIVGVSMDRMPRRELRSWLTRHRVSWPQIHDGRGLNGDVPQAFGVDRVPRSFLFDRRGRLVAVDLPAEALDAVVTGLLATRSAGAENAPATRAGR